MDAFWKIEKFHQQALTVLFGSCGDVDTGARDSTPTRAATSA